MPKGVVSLKGYLLSLKGVHFLKGYEKSLERVPEKVIRRHTPACADTTLNACKYAGDFGERGP